MHIKSRGDWTTQAHPELPEQLTYVNFEGPFETTTSNFIKYRTVIIVAIGIGTHAFISILNYCPPHTRVHLIFTTRQQRLLTLVRPARTDERPHVYFTRFHQEQQLRDLQMVHEAVFEATALTVSTGLRTHAVRAAGLEHLQEITRREMSSTRTRETPMPTRVRRRRR